MKTQVNELSLKKIIYSFITASVIILIFAFIDYLFHQLSNEYDVPGYYYKNKIIYGTIIGFLAYFLTRKQKLLTKTLVFSAGVSIILQIRYYLEGYPLDFVLLFLGIHFVILLAVSWRVFKSTEKLMH